MTAPKPPTPQAISALLKRAGFARELRSGRSGRGAHTRSEGFSAIGIGLTPSAAAVGVWHMGSGQPEAVALYASAIRAAGWQVELKDEAPDPPHLVVTAPAEEN